MDAVSFTANATKCIRCGACVSLLPSVFSLRAGPLQIMRQPSSAEERVLCDAALMICPSHAIGVAKGDRA